MREHEDFYSILQTLKKTGGVFDDKQLKKLSYSDLTLAALGNAGPCRCSVEKVVEEKIRRRKKYKTAKTIDIDLLDNLGMLADVYRDRFLNSSFPSWNDLSPVSKLWFKLSCLEAHVDYPEPRVEDVVKLLQECAESPTPLLPEQTARAFKSEFLSIHTRLPKIPDELLRNSCSRCSDAIFKFIPKEEVKLCEGLVLKDYSCTNSCFSLEYGS